MAKLICIDGVKMNGERHAPGDEIDVKDAKEVKRLIDLGAARKANAKATEPEPDPDKADKADKAAKPEKDTPSGK